MAYSYSKHIFETNGKWYFDDETGQECGPFKTKELAFLEFNAYCDFLMGVKPKRKHSLKYYVEQMLK